MMRLLYFSCRLVQWDVMTDGRHLDIALRMVRHLNGMSGNDPDNWADYRADGTFVVQWPRTRSAALRPPSGDWTATVDGVTTTGSDAAGFRAAMTAIMVSERDRTSR